jgi:secretion/DNA translocation related TadE-like protein
VSAGTRVARGAQGNVSVLVTAFIVVTMVLAGAVARLGGAVVDKSRAGNAADAAALAAAGALARGLPMTDACAVARTTAVDNGARLLTCRGAAGIADVVVALDRARARARAQFDLHAGGAVDGSGSESGIPHEASGSG